MNTLLNFDELEKFQDEINKYIKEKNIEQLFDVILKNILSVKPNNVFEFLYENLYSFFSNKIFIISPNFLKITSKICNHISKSLNYYHISTNNLIECYFTEINQKKNEDYNENDQKDKIILSNDFVFTLLKKSISSLNHLEKRGYIVEGFPNNFEQINDCMKLIPSHVFILIGNENDFYEKYEKENEINLEKDEENTIFKENFKTTYDSDSSDKLQLFEVKNFDSEPLKKKIKSYLRNVTHMLFAIKDEKYIINIKDYTDKEICNYILNIVNSTHNVLNNVFGFISNENDNKK